MPVPDLRLEDIEAFHQSVASGSFSAAARVLQRSTKQVARQVTRLEDTLGHVLLQRTTHALSLTHKGRNFQTIAGRLLDLGIEGLELLDDGDDQLAGELRVVVPSLNLGVTHWVRALRTEHPQLRFRIETSDEPVDLVAKGMDLQITVQRPVHATSVIRRLHVMRSELAAHRSYVDVAGAPDSPGELHDFDCLIWVTDAPQSRWLLFGPNGVQIDAAVSGKVHTSSSALLYDALRDGLGIGPIGRNYLRERGADRGFVRVLPDWEFEPTPVYAVYPSAARNSPLVEAFTEKARQGLEAWF